MSNFDALQTAWKVKSALGSLGSNPFDGEPDKVKGEDTDSLVTSVNGGLFAMFALGAMATAVLSMVATISVLVDVASISLLMLAPYTVYQKRTLRKLGGMRGQLNGLRQVRSLEKARPLCDPLLLFLRGSKQIFAGTCLTNAAMALLTYSRSINFRKQTMSYQPLTMNWQKRSPGMPKL